jgi:septum site-determining protein MinC
MRQVALSLSLGILPDTKPMISRTEPQEERTLPATKDKIRIPARPLRTAGGGPPGRSRGVVGGQSRGGSSGGKSIHVYGALRGRAVAGIHGYSEARIFCRNFDAELVSIAGQYKLNEDFDDSVRGRAVQIYLEQDRLVIQPFAG